MYGIRYIVIALGDPKEPATDQDVEALNDMIAERLGPFLTTTPLSERVSNKVTLALLQERGVL